MRLAVAIIILALLACALLASHQHKPFPLLVDGAGLAIEHVGGTYPPPRYQGNAIASPAYFVEPARVEGLCGQGFMACAVVGGGAMVLPDPCSTDFVGEQFAFITCHEVGHLRGWPAEHGE